MTLRTPDQILIDRFKAWSELEAKILQKISDRLELEYSGKPVELWVPDPQPKIVAIEAQLNAKLKATGWQLSFGHCNPDSLEGEGSILVITPLMGFDLNDSLEREQVESSLRIQKMMASFRIDRDLWTSFGQVAKSRRMTQAELLTAYISNVVSSSSSMEQGGVVEEV
jgi:hypothetical protein